MRTYVKVPCKHCPFRNDVTPYLHPERAANIAYSSENPYSDFQCHKTTESDEDGSESICTEQTKTCAGFLTMAAGAGIDTPAGFEPSWDIIYNDPFEMSQAYEEEWNNA